MLHQLETGQTLSGYRIESLIQTGGMGEVYRVINLDLDRAEALKLLKRELCHNSDFVERFVAEARRAAQLEHPNIIPIYRIIQEHGNQIFFTMKLVDGRSLSELIAEEGALPEEMVIDIVVQVTRALDYAHEGGVIHRDIKPANIMLDRFAHAYLLDFGIAKNLLVASNLTQTGTQMGTALYMSPEQAQNAKTADARSDLYSLGVVMFQMLTGELPFSGESEISVALKHIQEQPPDPKLLCPEISTDIRNIVLKLLAKSPNDRFQSARELLRAFKRETRPLTETPRSVSSSPVSHDDAATRIASGPQTEPLPAEPGKPVRRSWKLFALAGGLALPLMIGAGLILWDMNEKHNQVRLSVKVTPADARIRLGTEILPAGQPTILKAGEYKIEISRTDYDSQKETLNLKPGAKIEKVYSLSMSKATLTRMIQDANKLYGDGKNAAKVTESIKKFQEVLVHDPNQTQARSDLINIYTTQAYDALDESKYTETLSYVEKAKSYAPNKAQKELLADLLNSVAKAWRYEKTAKATELLKQAIAMDPKDLYKTNLEQL